MAIKPRQVEVNEILDGIANSHARAAAVAPESAGSCLRTDPQTGETTCTFTDPATCKSLNGVFLGGPCGD